MISEETQLENFLLRNHLQIEVYLILVPKHLFWPRTFRLILMTHVGTYRVPTWRLSHVSKLDLYQKLLRIQYP